MKDDFDLPKLTGCPHCLFEPPCTAMYHQCPSYELVEQRDTYEVKEGKYQGDLCDVVVNFKMKTKFWIHNDRIIKTERWE